MGALWIPYRRDTQLMKAILSQGVKHARISSDTTHISGSNLDGNSMDGTDTTSPSSPSSSSVSIIFCHADVRGAFMNDGARCRDGLDIAEFPRDLPIYSGHFHKPHTMTRGRSSLRYVGSPYQTSLSEAGQDKFLYCMQTKASAEARASSTSISTVSSSSLSSLSPSSTPSPSVTWSEHEPPWRLDIGRKHYKALSLKDPVVRVAHSPTQPTYFYTPYLYIHQHYQSPQSPHLINPSHHPPPPYQPSSHPFINPFLTPHQPPLIPSSTPLSPLHHPSCHPGRCVWRARATVWLCL